MNNIEEAGRDIAGLNGTDFEGRALKVNEARPKGQGSGGGRINSGFGPSTVRSALVTTF